MRVVTDTRDAGKRAPFEGQKIELKDRSEIGNFVIEDLVLAI